MSSSTKRSEIDTQLRPLLERFQRYHRLPYTQEEAEKVSRILIQARNRLPRSLKDRDDLRVHASAEYLGGKQLPHATKEALLRLYTMLDRNIKEVEKETGESTDMPDKREVCLSAGQPGHESYTKSDDSDVKLLSILNQLEQIITADVDDLVSFDLLDPVCDSPNTMTPKARATMRLKLLQEGVEFTPEDFRRQFVSTFLGVAGYIREEVRNMPQKQKQAMFEIYTATEQKMAETETRYAALRARATEEKTKAEEGNSATEPKNKKEKKKQQQTGTVSDPDNVAGTLTHALPISIEHVNTRIGEDAVQHSNAPSPPKSPNHEPEVGTRLRDTIHQLSILDVASAEINTTVSTKRLRQAVPRLPDYLKDEYQKPETARDFRDFVLGKKISKEKQENMLELYDTLLQKKNEVEKEVAEARARQGTP